MAKKYDDLKQWDDAIQLGWEYKKKYGDCERWSTYKQYYRGYFPGYTGTTHGILPYNLTYSTARTMIPNIYFRNPYLNITPRFKMGSPIRLDVHAKVVEAIDNWIMTEINLKREIKTGILDCYFTNRGIWKVGYDSEFGFSPKNVEAEMGLTDTTLTQYDRKGDAIEYNINIKPGMPWVTRIDPDDIIVPFGVRTLDESPWIVHQVLRPLSDVRADPKYKNTKDIKGTHISNLYKDTQRSNFYMEMSKICDWVLIREVRNRKTKEVFAYIPGEQFFIREPEEDVLQIEGLPFIDITFNEDPQYYWGPSDCAILEPQQLEVNEARTQAMMHRRVSLLKFLVDKNVIDKTEVDKMMSENVAPCVMINGTPSTAVTQLQPHIPADLIGWVEQIRQDVREMVGMGRQQSGEAPSGRRTATEMQIVQSAKELRMDERRDIVADALVDIMRKVNQVIFSNWDKEHVVQVVGMDGAKYWVEYTKEAIIGEYNTRVDIESMTPSTKAMRRKEIVELIGALANNPRVNIDYLLKMLLREYDWIDAMAVLPDAPETANGTPMPMEEYTNKQQNMQASPSMLQARVRRTQNAVSMGV